MADFKQRFLLRNAEESLQTDLSLLSIAKGLQGGINDPTQFPRWLDDNLLSARPSKASVSRRPYIWINASDIYNRTPFVFGHRLSAPVQRSRQLSRSRLRSRRRRRCRWCSRRWSFKSYTGRLSGAASPLGAAVRKNPNAPPLLQNLRQRDYRYHSGEVRYVKLLDGGIVDNYGLAGSPSRGLVSDTAYGPLSARRGREIAAYVFPVVDAGRGPSGAWVQTVEGPTGANLITAASDTATESGAVGSLLDV